jgi:hypothetical protein
MPVKDLGGKQALSEVTLYRGRAKLGGRDASEAKRRRQARPGELLAR